jgi:hypothetical protein
MRWRSLAGKMGVMLALLVALVGCRAGSPPTPTATQPVASPSATPAYSPEATTPPDATPVGSPEATSPPSTPVESSSPTPSSTPTLAPTETPQVAPTIAADDVVVRETTLSIAGYVYEPFLRDAFDAERGLSYAWLDRGAYGEPSPETVVLRPFTAIVMENRYLRLTILPELGGRLYECIFKPTGQNLFYRNQVLKPTRWGPLAREQNWWLAAGGMEWAFPVTEHGYEWGVPWSYTVERSASATTVVVRDTTEDRLRLSVEIGLAADTAYFTVTPRIENRTDSPVSYQYWTNALLSLGDASISPNTEFSYPTEEILVHSAGPDSGLPGERSVIDWPVWQGRDLSWYYNWEDWLGFFLPEPSEDFVGAYNHDTSLGVARVFDRREAPGVKLFAWGQQSPYVSEYTDDGSQYFEMWGGPIRTFWPEDDETLAAGHSRSWTEYWYPFQGIGGLAFANRDVALSVTASDDEISLGLATTCPQEGTLVLTVGEQEVYRRDVTVSPDNPHVDRVSLPAGLTAGDGVTVTYLNPVGEVLASYTTDSVSQ